MILPIALTVLCIAVFVLIYKRKLQKTEITKPIQKTTEPMKPEIKKERKFYKGIEQIKYINIKGTNQQGKIYKHISGKWKAWQYF